MSIPLLHVVAELMMIHAPNHDQVPKLFGDECTGKGTSPITRIISLSTMNTS